MTSLESSWNFRSPKFLLVSVVAMAALTAADLWSKDWALEHLSAETPGVQRPVCEPDAYGRRYMQRTRKAPVVWIEGYLELRYAENCGAAFGMLRDAPKLMRNVVFGIAAVLASAFLVWILLTGRGGIWMAVSVPMIIAGAIGNLTDRLRYGYVVDFIRFHLQDGWEYPTFNVADAWITIGVVFMILDSFGERSRAQAAAPAVEPQHTEA